MHVRVSCCLHFHKNINLDDFENIENFYYFLIAFAYYWHETSLNGVTWSVRIYIADLNLFGTEA